MLYSVRAMSLKRHVLARQGSSSTKSLPIPTQSQLSSSVGIAMLVQ